MRSDNFVAFITVQGFFIGLVFGLLKATSADGILVYTVLITVFFYLLAHFFVALFFRTMQARSHYFPKAQHERDLDAFVREIAKREKMIESVQEMTRSAMQLNAEEKARSQA